MKRAFILGDEWIYYKLYCGKRISDVVLVNTIKPLVEKLINQNLISKWFFIRYKDPDTHLRVRFLCTNIDQLGTIINLFNKAISSYVENDLIWKIQTDTYFREIERYGKDTIEEAESFFNIDSTLCVNALEVIEDDILLFAFTLRSINIVFDAFDYSINDRLFLTKRNLEAFKFEFNSNKTLSKQLNKKYNNLKTEIIEFLEMEHHFEYQVLIDLLNTQKLQLNKIKTNILEKNTQNKINIDDLISSYIHMMVNRIFRDKQRLHELVCYDNLYRFYNFKLVKSNASL